MEKENIDRHTEKLSLEIEISDIIWRMHQKTYKVTIAIVALQLLFCILLVVVQNVFKNVQTDFYGLSLGTILGLCVPYINIALLIIVVINNRVSNKAWNTAREDYRKLFDIIDPIFNKDYNVENQFDVINNLCDYKKERLACKQDTKIQKEKTLK